MPVWTAQQQEVISSDSRRIICSAAAGSGKTAVMIERIVRMLREGADPESFLVVTFTNAAAAEMKQKIRDRLRAGRSEKNLRRALEKIDLMEISTIHSFCQRLIRREFQAADTDPFFAVCEEARARKLFSDSFRAACATLQKEENEDYFRWKKRFSRKETEEIVRSVHTFMMSLPDPYGWLKRSCGDVPLRVDPSHPWFETASAIVREKLAAAGTILRRQFRMFGEPEHGEPYRAVWKADSELFHVKQSWADGKEVSAESLKATMARLPVWSKLTRAEADWKERYCELREKLKALFGEIDELVLCDPVAVERDFGNMRDSLRGLREITLRTAENFAKKKKALRLLDFNDLEHRALKILRSDPEGPEVRSRWTRVFVDECQDVSRVQDEIIQRLYAGEGGPGEADPDARLFMVGDVKQSIYRFRLAEPRMFLDRSRAYESGGADGQLLKLQSNFRSRPEILETVNTVFRDIMTNNTAEMDYTQEEALLPGLLAEGFFPVLVDVPEADPERTKLETAAADVALRVGELRREGFEFRDMVILMPRVNPDGPKLAELLEKRGVPVFYDGGTDFYTQPEVSAFLGLLSCIANPFLDEPLLIALKYAPFFFTEEELAQVRLRDPGKDVPFRDAFARCLEETGAFGDRCREADAKLREWRNLSSVLPVRRLVRTVCMDSHHYAMAGAAPAGETARRNLRVLFRKAEEAGKAGVYSLRRFLSFVSEQSGGDARAAVSLSPADNVVRLMTMHKSKGLQFPVVFCVGLDGQLSRPTESAAVLDAELGICLRYKRPEMRLSRNTPAYRVFAWKKEKEQRAERIRLLYVAMTRAQERMILVGTREEGTCSAAPAGESRVLSAETFMDWIVPSLADAEKLSTGYAQGQTPWKISVPDINQQENVENPESYPQFSEWLDSLLSAPPVDELWKNSQEEPLLSRMQKKSVTALLKKAEREIDPEEEAVEETPGDKRIPERFSAALRRSEIHPYPSFMLPPEEKRGAWRGTVIHRFLSLLDLDRLRPARKDFTEPLRQMKEEMLARGVFTPEEGAVIRPEDADAFFRSRLGQRVLRAGNVRREWAFNLCRPERNLLVQGILDCAFREKDGWVILDFKTDRTSDLQGLSKTYSPQLRWYAEALRELTGEPVKECWLWSLACRRAVRAET